MADFDNDQNAANTSSKKYDLVVFGASGFTGQYVVEEVARTIEQERNGLQWAVAGRSVSKLIAVLKEAERQTGKSLEEVPTIVADVSNQQSLLEMCEQTKLVLNCVGPYRFYGHQVVKACIESNTHHIDISGEPGFLESCQLMYDKKAKESGTYIVGACGWDSIPSEMGFKFTQSQGDVESIESYIQVHFGPEGGHGNFGTWQSAIYGFAYADELKTIRKQLYNDRLTVKPSKREKRGAVFRHEDSWITPFVGCDRSVVMRTQRYNRDHRGQQPIAFEVFNRTSGLSAVFFLLVCGVVFMFLAKFKFGRSLLEKYPHILSLGMFKKEGPTRKQIEGASFTNTMFATVSGEEKKLITRISGPEIGYAATPICMVQAAYCLLNEKEKLPQRGGVFTPGVAFGETTLINRLEKHGVHFEVQQKP